jgi:hypothetical protein
MCQFTRTVSAALLTATVLVIAPMAAGAATFDFSFSGGFYSGSGEFTSSSVSSPFLITGISGSISDSNVNGGALSAITSIDTSYFGPDNLLSFPTTPFVDFSGISFDTASLAYNLFSTAGLYGVQRGNFVSEVSLIVTEEAVTPLPAALPLFATGLGGLGLLGWRRKRKAEA